MKEEEMRIRGRTIGRGSIAGAILGLVGASPMAALHPGHGDHAGILGGAFHILLQSGAGMLLVASIVVALFARRREIR
jgi:Zn-dependent protease with chaperone function